MKDEKIYCVVCGAIYRVHLVYTEVVRMCEPILFSVLRSIKLQASSPTSYVLKFP